MAKKTVATKHQLAVTMAKKLRQFGFSYTSEETEKLLDAMILSITEILQEGTGVIMKGFCTIELRKRAAKFCHATGVMGEEKTIPFARFHNTLKNQVRNIEITYKGCEDEYTD